MRFHLRPLGVRQSKALRPKLEAQSRPTWNLEGSVRSRGTEGEGGRDRDLIEAGLSEPAGWRAGLWGLCLRHSVRDRPSAEAREDVDGLTTGEDDWWRRRCALSAAVASIGAAAARRGITAASRDDTIGAGAVGVRCLEGGAVGRSADHDVSCRNDG